MHACIHTYIHIYMRGPDALALEEEAHGDLRRRTDNNNININDTTTTTTTTSTSTTTTTTKHDNDNTNNNNNNNNTNTINIGDLLCGADYPNVVLQRFYNPLTAHKYLTHRTESNMLSPRVAVGLAVWALNVVFQNCIFSLRFLAASRTSVGWRVLSVIALVLSNPVL